MTRPTIPKEKRKLPSMGIMRFVSGGDEDEDAETDQSHGKYWLRWGHWRGGVVGVEQEAPLASLSDEDIAKQLTLIEKRLFRAIAPREFVGKLWLSPDRDSVCPNLIAVILQFEVITNWVTHAITSHPGVKARKKLMAKFIRVAKELLQLQNFNTFVAVIAGLNNCTVYKLRFTRDDLPRSVREVYERIKPLASNSDNYSSMRRQMENAIGPYLPFLAITLSDLVSAHDSPNTYVTVHKTTFGVVKKRTEITLKYSGVNENGQSMLNIEKLKNMSCIIQNIQLLQNSCSSMDIKPNPAVRTVLTKSIEESKTQACTTSISQDGTQKTKGRGSSIGIAPLGVLKEGFLFKLTTGMRRDWKRRWFVLENRKMYYYRNWETFERVEVCDALLVTVREHKVAQKTSHDDSEQETEGCTFELISPNRRAYILKAESTEERDLWISAIRRAIETCLATQNRLSRMIEQSNPATKEIREMNPICADCDAVAPEWVSTNLCVVICIDCSGIHRGLGSHISRVKSLDLDVVRGTTLMLLRSIGNQVANRLWEGSIPDSGEFAFEKPHASSPR